MGELSYPTTGGGSVTDSNYENLIGTAIQSGLIGRGDSATIVYGDSSGRQVKVRASRAAIVRGYRWQTDGAGITRAIAANASGQPRIDLAILRLNRSDWTVTFQVLQGTPAASPVAPTPTQSDGPAGVWELPLAQIAVANGATNILPADVTVRGGYINSHIYEGPRAFLPTSGMQSRQQYANDVHRMLLNTTNSGWIITGERDSWFDDTSFTMAWDKQVVRYRRVNGFVLMNAQVYYTGPGIAANVAATMFNIPTQYRPDDTGDFVVLGFHSPYGDAVRCLVKGSSGDVTLENHNNAIAGQQRISLHPVMWPAKNV